MADDYSYDANATSISEADSLPETSGTTVACQAFMLKMCAIFGFDKFPLVFDDDPKGAIKRARGNSLDSDDRSIYPFGYFRITSTGVKDDAHNAKTALKHGTGYAITPEMENAVISKLYKLWANVDLEVFVEFSNAIQMLKFAEKMSMCIKAKSLTTGVALDNGDEWSVIFSGSPQITIPQATKDSETSPNIYVVNFQIAAHTQFGESRDVPKINNEGRITVNAVVANTAETLTSDGDH